MQKGIRSAIWVAALVGRAAAEPSRAESDRRHDELVKQGFSFTQSMSFHGKGRAEFLVPLSDAPNDEDEHVVSLWFEAEHDALDVRLVGPGGAPLASFSARSGEHRLARKMASGRYVVEIDHKGDELVRGIVAVKGGAVGACAVDARRISEHPANPGKGWSWPYLVVTPEKARGRSLLVLPNSTGFPTEDLDVLRASATCQVKGQLELADRLGVPILVPLFPRPPLAPPEDDLYLHALTRAALQKLPAATNRVDLQLLAMIDDAIGANERVLLLGFSASGSFVNRFAMLHPSRVRAVAVGSPGGWPLAPVATDGSDRLPYPVGIADVEAMAGGPIDRAALAKVAWFFFLGGEDQNDAVPYRDSFSASDEALIMRRYGKTPVDRWGAAAKLYEKAGLRADFRSYPGVGHDITPPMKADIEAFFRRALGAP